jgi:hypothetical protein
MSQIEGYQVNLNEALSHLTDLHRQNPLNSIKRMHDTIAAKSSLLSSSLAQLNGVLVSMQ